MTITNNMNKEKCGYPDCGFFPHCGRTCGMNDSELVVHMNQQIRDLRYDMNRISYQAQIIKNASEEIKEIIYN